MSTVGWNVICSCRMEMRVNGGRQRRHSGISHTVNPDYGPRTFAVAIYIT